MRRTKEDAQHTREALLDAAEVLFAQRGVTRSSLQEIAKLAGVTRGAVYWHFKDKADLFNAMMARTSLPMEEAIQTLNCSLQPPLEAIKHCAMDTLSNIAHDPRTRRVFEIVTQKVELIEELEAVRQRRIQVSQKFFLHVRIAFERAQSLGYISPHLSIEAVNTSYHALLMGIINQWLLMPDAFDLPDMGEQCLDLYLNGLRPPQKAANETGD